MWKASNLKSEKSGRAELKCCFILSLKQNRPNFLLIDGGKNMSKKS